MSSLKCEACHSRCFRLPNWSLPAPGVSVTDAGVSAMESGGIAVLDAASSAGMVVAAMRAAVNCRSVLIVELLVHREQRTVLRLVASRPRGGNPVEQRIGHGEADVDRDVFEFELGEMLLDDGCGAGDVLDDRRRRSRLPPRRREASSRRPAGARNDRSSKFTWKSKRRDSTRRAAECEASNKANDRGCSIITRPAKISGSNALSCFRRSVEFENRRPSRSGGRHLHKPRNDRLDVCSHIATRSVRSVRHCIQGTPSHMAGPKSLS